MRSWINSLPEVLTANRNGQYLSDLLEWLVDPCIEFVKKNCKVSLVIVTYGFGMIFVVFQVLHFVFLR